MDQLVKRQMLALRLVAARREARELDELVEVLGVVVDITGGDEVTGGRDGVD